MSIVPLPGPAIDSLLKGAETGSNMMAKMMNARYNNSLHPSGDVANALYVEQLKGQYGENDPRYLQAKAAHDMGLASRQSLMDYRTQLSNLAPFRAASPLGKSIAEGRGKGALDMFPQGGMAPKAGMVEGESGRTLSPEMAQAYEQDIAKKTTDAAIRNKIPYAENVKITLNSIKPKSLVQYSGPMGSIKYAKDFVQAAMGSPSPEFLDYNDSVTSSKTLAKQLRQFWGDSIQPSARQEIEKLTNPSHWSKSPEVAERQFMQLKNITDQELVNFTRHGTSPIKLNFKNGSFVAEGKKNQRMPMMEEPAQEIAVDEAAMASDDFLNQLAPQLLELSPQATPENIRHTAKELGITIEEAVRRIMKKYGSQ